MTDYLVTSLRDYLHNKCCAFSGFILVPISFSYYLVFNLQLGDRWMACNSDEMNCRLVRGILNGREAHKNKTLYHQTFSSLFCSTLCFS